MSSAVFTRPWIATGLRPAQGPELDQHGERPLEALVEGGLVAVQALRGLSVVDAGQEEVADPVAVRQNRPAAADFDGGV